jgi:hypothetical protein
MGLEEMIKRYIVTAGEVGASPNNKQLDAYETYASENGAEIIVIPILGQYPQEELNERLQRYRVANELELSKHLSIRDFGIKAQNINPLTGLRRFGSTDKSMIVGSTKQHLEHVANSNKNEPKAVMSTGACTLPNYKDYMRIGRIAMEDHVQGALAIDVDTDTGEFFQRQIRNISDGSFIDMGVKYTPDGKARPVRADTMVLGDLHTAQIDKVAYEAACEQINTLKPSYVMLHDIFDGTSISHHEQHRPLLRGRKAQLGQTDLYAELYNLGELLHELTSQGSRDTQYLVVKSNHDEVIDRYLEECRFTGDERNLQLAVRLANAYMDGKDPLKEGIMLTYGHLPKNLKFLQRDDEFNRHGWQLANHGDKGPSGSRGSMISYDYSLGKAIVGHNHSASVRKDIYRVGTLERTDVDYVKGTTGNWTHTNAVLYPNGKAQLITSIKGRWMI